MNPKLTTNLDPKLRETYERVMGTTFPTPQAPPQPAQPVAPPPPPQSQPVAPVAPPVEQQRTQPIFTTTQVPDPTPLAKPVDSAPEMVQSPVFNAGNPFSNTPLPKTGAFTKSVMLNNAPTEEHKKNKLIPVILTLGGVVFFVVYTIIWAKVFGLI